MARKKTTISELRVGLLAIGAIVILIIFILSVTGDIALFKRRLTYTTRFNTAEGLKAGDEVRLAGKLVGKVENVGYRLFEQGMPESEIDEAVRRMLRFVNLEQSVDMMPSELSGGMRRRVGIARALVGNPKLILFDEPTAGLDPITARTILELAMKLRDLEGVSSIFVTHRLEDIKLLSSNYATINEDGEVEFKGEDNRFCLVNTKFLMLKEGKIIFSGTDEELAMSDHPYVRDFFREF